MEQRPEVPAVGASSSSGALPPASHNETPPSRRILRDERARSPEAVRKESRHTTEALRKERLLSSGAAELSAQLQRDLAGADLEQRKREPSCSLEDLNDETIVAEGVAAERRAVAELVKLLSDDKWEVQCEAISALGIVGELGAVAVPQIMAKLKDPNKGVRQAACRALGGLCRGESKRERLGEELVAMLQKNMDNEPLTQALAAQCLGDISARAFAGHLQELLERSTHAEVRAAAATALAALKERPDAIAKLLLSASSEDRAAALDALAGLGEEAGPWAADVAARLVEPLLREAALNALGALGEAAAPHVPKIVGFLSNVDIEVRFAAVRALAKLKAFVGSESVAAAAELLSHRDARIRAAGASALGMLGEEKAGTYAEKVCDLLTDDAGKPVSAGHAPLWMRMPNCAAARALSCLGSKGASLAPSIAAHCKNDPSLPMRLSTIEALGSMGEKGAAHARVVADCLGDTEPHIVITALHQLAQMFKFRDSCAGAELDTTIAQAMVEAISSLETGLRPQAIKSVGVEGAPPVVVDAIVGWLKEANDEVTMTAAAQALGAVGPLAQPAATEAVAALLVHKGAAVRHAAATAMGSMRATQRTAEVAALLTDIVEIRKAAVVALGQLGEAGAKHNEEVAALLGDPVSTVRQSACKSLGKMLCAGQILSPGTMQSLESALQDDVECVRKAAQQALEQHDEAAGARAAG